MNSNNKIPKNLGKKIQKYRKELGMLQSELAFKVGISENYMGHIEQGKKLPSIEVLNKISKYIKRDIADLFK